MTAPPAWLLTLLETVLNGVLRLQPDFLDQLNSQFQGKRIQLCLVGPQWVFVLQPSPAGIRITAATESTADLNLSLSPAAFFKLAQGEWASSPELEIHGDIQLARQLQMLVQDWDHDWEEWLAKAFGDIPAYHLSNMLRSGFDWSRTSADALQADVSEYLRYETKALPDHHRVQRYLQDVDNLRDAVERLDARIARLQRLVAP
jgi:ubiquinone biosynthesis protein UbiJ